MRMNRFFSILSLALAAILLAGATTPKPRLTFEGLGPIRIGMTVSQVKKLGFKLTTSGALDNEEERFSCHYLDSAPAYPGIALMMNEDRLVRIDVSSVDVSQGSKPGQKLGAWQSLSGARIGMSEQEVRDIYGDWMKKSGHPYLDEAGSYLTLTSSDGKFAMTFETAVKDIGAAASESKSTPKYVTDFRAGLAGAVGYIEGCS